VRLCEEEQRVFRFIAARERSGRRTKPVDIKAALNLTPHIWTQLLAGRGVIFEASLGLTEKGRSLAIALLGPEREESPNRPNPVRQHEEILAIYAACIKRDGPPKLIGSGG